jgi:hypothetical protein
MAELEQSLTATFGFYVDMATQIAADPATERADAADAVRRQFKAQGVSLFDKYQDLLLAHVKQLGDRGRAPSEVEKRAWLLQIDETRSLREGQPQSSRGGRR